MKVNAIIIALFNVYPPTSGGASVSYNVAKYYAGNKVLIQVGNEDRSERLADDFEVITIKGSAGGRWNKLLGISDVIRRITDKVTQLAPDDVLFAGSSWVCYFMILLRSLKKNKCNATIIYQAHNVEYELRRQKHSWPIVMLTKWAEGYLFRMSDIATVVSEVDRDQIKRLYGVSPQLLPNGVDIVRFDAVTQVEIDTIRRKYGICDKTILFMGFYYYRPNQEGIDFLVKEVMPKVIKQCPGARLAVIGSEIPYHESWLITPGVIHHSWLPAIVKACGIGVAPIFSGSGTRLKILEYMAAGLPVVSTSKGAEGIGVVADQNILIAENHNHFAGQIIKLLRNRELAVTIGAKGKAFVRGLYTWPAIIDRYHAEVKSEREKNNKREDQYAKAAAKERHN
jgi:glycosyltransferase involved in cell wall biosynthesis